MPDILARIAAIEQRLNAAPQGNPWIRLCTLVTVDTSTWKATVMLAGQTYSGIDVAQQIKIEALIAGTDCLVAFDSFDSPYHSVLFVTFGGRPPPALEMDNVRGHSHRKGVPGDGAPVYTGDLVDQEVEK